MSLIEKLDFFNTLGSLLVDLPITQTNRKLQLYNIPCGFDIETSSFYLDETKYAIMYEWTFGIGLLKDNEFKTYITYGRTWDEFEAFLHAIACLLQCNPENRRLIVYVHNLPYEWQFIRKRFSWSKVFLMDDRKPVYAITDDGIEFRCSLKLSGKSLANTAKDLQKYKVTKAEGDLDYSKIRHPNTPLTEKEWGYCERDVEVMLAYVQEKIEADGNITKIPLTKTGYVRRYCKSRCFQEGELPDISWAYEDADLDTSGIHRIERSIYRRIYPRKFQNGESNPSESWFVRLYEFLSGEYGGVSIPYEQREIFR